MLEIKVYRGYPTSGDLVLATAIQLTAKEEADYADSPSSLLRRLNAIAKHDENILSAIGVDNGDRITWHSLDRVYTDSDMAVISNLPKDGVTSTEWSEHVVTTALHSSGRPIKPVSIDGVESDYYLTAVFYRTGFVLSTGKETAPSVFSAAHPAYLTKLRHTRDRVTMSARTRLDAKVFSTMAAMQKFLEKEQVYLCQFAERYGYQFSLDTASDPAPSVDDYLNHLVGRKKVTEVKAYDSIQTLLAAINKAGENEPEPEELTGDATPEEMQKEAMHRLEGFKVMGQVISRFKNGGLYISENGALYDLDDDAKRAAEIVRSHGNVPYHVIRNYTAIGTMDAVLYVSHYKEDWQYERYNQRTNSLTAYVVNGDIEDVGEIGVMPSMGGLTRTF